MVTLGVDAHKRTHTIVAVDEHGAKVAERTIGTTTKDHLGLLRWAAQLGVDRTWAVEDCRHLSRRLERDLLAAGESIVRVPPKLMAATRNSSRTFGKSDPIDALAVARAALREPDLPLARLDGPDREVRLLVDHRESLVAERTRIICRLRWHLHELDPSWEPNARALDRASAYAAIEQHIAGRGGVVARLARALVVRCRQLTLDARTRVPRSGTSMPARQGAEQPPSPSRAARRSARRSAWEKSATSSAASPARSLARRTTADDRRPGQAARRQPQCSTARVAGP